MIPFVIQIYSIVQPQHHEDRAKIPNLPTELLKGETGWWDRSYERHIVTRRLLSKVISLACPWAFQASQRTFCKVHSCQCTFVYGKRARFFGFPRAIRIRVTFKWSAYLAPCCELWQLELSACEYELARRAQCHSRPLGGALLWGERWHAPPNPAPPL